MSLETSISNLTQNTSIRISPDLVRLGVDGNYNHGRWIYDTTFPDHGPYIDGHSIRLQGASPFIPAINTVLHDMYMRELTVPHSFPSEAEVAYANRQLFANALVEEVLKYANTALDTSAK
ncbi:MAG: hypothetical protein WCO06_07645 [Candidatus Roizmanbacteria bacterium]